MKIVFFSSDNYAASGAFRAEVNLINDLKKHGHDVTLVLPNYGTGTQLTKPNNIKTKHILSCQWVRPNNKSFKSKMLKIVAAPTNWFASLRIKCFLKRTKADLAVINTLWTCAGAKAAIKCKIPLVWHLREVLEVGQNHTFINPDKSYRLINQANICLAVTNYVKDYYSKNINPDNVKVIYDGVDKIVFYNPNKILFKDNKVHFLMLGTVNDPKGQHIGLKALNTLFNYNFDVKIVGACEEDYKNKLLEMCPNIKDRITFIQPTKHPEEFYKQCDVFLMNSIGEAFGLVTAEAMMGGMVVVSSKCGGGKEIVLDEKHGYFYTPLDWQELATKIKDIFDNKTKAKRIAKAGQTRALECFNKELNSKLVEDIYKKQKIEG